jgi:hypothetical protein
MSSRYAAWIRIGGTVDRASAGSLLNAVRQAWAKRDWNADPFQPSTIDELLEAREDGWLWLYDEEAKYGEFEGIERVCRELGLSYCRHTEAWCGDDAVLLDWRPGMEQPLVRTGSNDNSDVALVPEDPVRNALAALEAGDAPAATRILEDLCPQVPDLPPFEIV